MRPPLVVVAWAACMFAAQGPQRIESKLGDPKARWTGSIEEALRGPCAGGRPLLLLFVASDSPHSLDFERGALADRRVVEALRDYCAVRVEVGAKGAPDPASYGVASVPAIVILDPDRSGPGLGDARGLLGFIAGAVTPRDLLPRLAVVNRGRREFDRLDRRLRQAPRDLECLGRLVPILAVRRDERRAKELLKAGLDLDPRNQSGRLTEALNSVGDLLQEANDHEGAVALYRIAAAAGRPAADVFYARLSISASMMALRRYDDAEAELVSAERRKGLAREDRELVEALRKHIRDARASRPAAPPSAADPGRQPTGAGAPAGQPTGAGAPAGQPSANRRIRSSPTLATSSGPCSQRAGLNSSSDSGPA